MSNYTYMVTNNINGKVYVGSHTWSGEGIDPDYYGSGIAITSAVKKYGKENFQVEVLYYYDTVEECRKDEERILTEYNVRDCPHSYNCKNAAVGWTSEDVTGENNPMYGKHHTDASRNKMSEARKGENNPWYGKHLSDEHRKKLSQAHKGKTFSEETRKKLSEAHKGKTLSDEHRKKLSQANKGEKHPMYGKHHTEDAKSKMSQAQNYIKIPIVAIQLSTGKIRMFESQRECARQLNLNSGHIYQCLRGRQKTCKGYIIKYMEQLESGIYEGITGIAE